MEYKNYEITIEQDVDPEDPCEAWDMFGSIACTHRRYNLGHEQLEVEKIEEIYKNTKEYVSLPVYLYDHSELTVSTSPFGCPWDSGQVGIIYISKTDIRNEFKKKRISQKVLSQVAKQLEGTVKTYDAYLTGNVWGYTIEKDGEFIDSCWSFFGDSDYCLSEAKNLIDSLEGE